MVISYTGMQMMLQLSTSVVCSGDT